MELVSDGSADEKRDREVWERDGAQPLVFYQGAQGKCRTANAHETNIPLMIMRVDTNSIGKTVAPSTMVE
jgi:hypothetical protein